MTDVVNSPALAQPERAYASRAHGFVDWPAIFAGAMVAVAVSFIAATFGSAIGLSATLPYRGPQPVLFYVALGIWMIFVAVSSFAAGGYVAGRLRRPSEGASPHARDVRDCLHGLVVWALAAVAGALLAAATVGAIAKTAADKGLAPTDRYVDLLLRGEGVAAAKGANPVSDATRSFVSRLVAENPSGDFSNEDKSYLSSVVTGAGAPPATAADRVNRVASEMKADANKARKVGIYLAFLTAATLAVGAATAWGATRLGGRHRDQDVDLGHLVRAPRERSQR
ncbi:hypothetical protein [Methylocystis bryophila]|uniref:Mll5186 protein n=1 Tax=Methylocystis bryophila TaxID=655015 RepID=A0A1W6MTP0_9HYPH|nr:hypothetical protein [Methylocystis bryophila]ARN80970.1 hypothetical protein B1812_07670 [Methylocystis bryophila]BDV36877.1 hypothetical protein DSM21852_01300 [Methylocystis bryophila]